MEGETTTTNKLKFLESKKKYKNNQDPSQVIKRITAANNHDLILFCYGQTIAGLSINQLLDFDKSKKTELLLNNQFPITLPLTFRPTLITVARNGYSSTLLVCGLNLNNTITIEAFDLDTKTSIGKIDLNELGNQSEIVDYSWHPNYFESIVALCTKTGNLLVVAIDRKNKAISLALNISNYGALTCAWSPKGKNLAIGKDNGTILRLEPIIENNKFSFKEVDKSTINFIPHPRITPGHKVIRLRWLNKTYLLCVHAKLVGGPDTVYSIITVKPTKPHLFWTNICLESQPNNTNYMVHIVNLTNGALCTSNISGEAATIGVNSIEEANRGELRDYKNFIIDEEGARIELPLDASNRETYAEGVTATFLNNQPVIIFYTTDGLICAYLLQSTENIMKLPEFQKPLDCPITALSKQPEQQQSFQTHSFGSSGLFQSSTTSFYNPLATVPQQQQQTNIFGSGGLFQSTAPAFYNPLSKQPEVQQQQQQQQSFPSHSFGSTGLFKSSTSSFYNPLAGLSQGLGSQSVFGQSPTTKADNSTFGTSTALDFSTLAKPLQQPQTQQQLLTQQQQPQTQQQQPQTQQQQPQTQQQQPQTQLQPQQQPQAQAQQLAQIQPQKQPQPQQQPLTQQQQQQQQPQTQHQQPLAQQQQPQTQQQQPQTQQQQPQTQLQPQQQPQAQAQAQAQQPQSLSQPENKSSNQSQRMKEIPETIAELRKSIQFNEVFLTLLEDINHLRKQFHDIKDFHNIHLECLGAIREDINQLDIGMLENLYLIEYIKNRQNSKKRSIDPNTLKKVNDLKQKSKVLSEKLKELSINVDVSWEEFLRRKTKDTKINSLDIIYHTLATNQKIITALQRKVASSIPISSPSKNPEASLPSSLSCRRETDPAKLKAFKEFLASRNYVPVRRVLN